MKLSAIAKKPNLVEITLDSEDVVAEVGESVTFYTWDRAPISSFLRLANVNMSDTASVISAVRDLVLDEEGKPIIQEDVALPAPVLMAALTAIVERLGKF
jgi:hypothetical protein